MESTKANENKDKFDPRMVSEQMASVLANIDKNIRKLSDQKNVIKKLQLKLKEQDFISITKITEDKSITELQTAFPELKETLDQIRVIAQREIEPKILSFDKDLREQLAKADLRREWWFPDIVTGKFPEYTINKMIRVLVDTKNLSVSVNNQIIRDFDIQQITSKIMFENNRLFSRPFNSQRFVDQLYNAYEKTCLKNKKNVGELVHLKEVYNTMVFETQKPQFFNNASRANFVPYESDEFTIDLSRYLKNHPTVSRNGAKPELHPLRDSQEALYITLPNGEQVYKGLISFTRA